MDLATLGSGVSAGLHTQKDASLRDHLRNMLDRNGVMPAPLPEPEDPVDLEAVARAEEDEMAGYHGLSVDGVSGMQMFYTGNTLSDKKRKEKRAQFHVVRFYVELARKAQAGAEAKDNDGEDMTPTQATVADLLYNSTSYTAWLCFVYAVHMCMSFWEPAYIGADNPTAAPALWVKVTLELCCIAAFFVDCVLQCVALGWKGWIFSFWNKCYVGCLGLFVADAVMTIAGGTLSVSRFARPVLVYVRHSIVRSEAVLFMRCATQSRGPAALLVAVIAVGSIFALALMKNEYGFLSVATAGSVQSLTALSFSSSDACFHRECSGLLAHWITGLTARSWLGRSGISRTITARGSRSTR